LSDVRGDSSETTPFAAGSRCLPAFALTLILIAAATTTAVRGEVAEAEPSALVAVTTTRIIEPTSARVS
jgi:hypothetical protein